ncbi:ATP-binding protein [Sedimentitalea sp. JM2-8]|uniref:ATP-binding protein n=1 Tax=Sedimentitalea xiamensis TaxID=3050037 RepID=A0ABT7FC85_9RHOB|nr:ATP-binding protein [Sedimentitalea xiamensis]MDK3072728.1 ATP-binding protein [Sedimentitalea xiamensis]
MTQHMALGNSIQPLRNVAALVTLIKRVQKRGFGLPGMATFYGPPGFGKTYAACHAAAALDAIHIPVQKLWTKKTLLTSILNELSIVPRPTMADMMMQVNEGLALSGRPLIIDEADYAVARGLIEIIRDFHDGSSMPVILIGMEMLPQKLSKWELVDGRMLAWVGAEPADLRDAQMLARVYARDIVIDDALLERIVTVNKGNARRISTDLAHVNEQSLMQGSKRMTLDAWGDAPFLRGEAPAPRRGIA